MTFVYVPQKPFKQPERVAPSSDYHGEESTAPIHLAVGRALSMWEHAESAWGKGISAILRSSIISSSSSVRDY